MEKKDPLLLRNHIHHIIEDRLGDDSEEWNDKFTPMLNDIMMLLYKQLSDCLK
jgi:hypothetical protein